MCFLEKTHKKAVFCRIGLLFGAWNPKKIPCADLSYSVRTGPGSCPPFGGRRGPKRPVWTEWPKCLFRGNSHFLDILGQKSRLFPVFGPVPKRGHFRGRNPGKNPWKCDTFEKNERRIKNRLRDHVGGRFQKRGVFGPKKALFFGNPPQNRQIQESRKRSQKARLFGSY